MAPRRRQSSRRRPAKGTQPLQMNYYSNLIAGILAGFIVYASIALRDIRYSTPIEAMVAFLATSALVIILGTFGWIILQKSEKERFR